MIIDELYTTSFSADNIKATNVIGAIPITTEEFTKAYWLGWINNDNVPNVFKVGTFNIVEGDDPCFSFRDITDYSINRDFTYFCTTDGSGGSADTYTRTNSYYSETYSKWVVNYNARLVNDMIYQSTGYSMVFLTIYAPPVTGHANTSEYKFMTVKEFIDFINGDYSQTITLSGVDYTFTGQDFDDDGILWIEYAEDSKRPVAIVNYQFLPGNSVLPGTRYGVLYPSLHAGYEFDSNKYDGVCSTRNAVALDAFLKINASTLAINRYSADQMSDDNIVNYPRTWNGVNTDIYVSDLAGVTSEPFVKDGVIVSYSYGSGGTPMFYDFYRVYSPADIYKHASLLRWCVGDNIIGYSANVVYYPAVDLSTNEFLGYLITGDEEYVKPRIPEWMKSDLSENTYTEDDKPIPEIPEDETKDTGDSIPNRGQYYSGAYNFITQYAMNRFQLGSFGSMLWTSWVDSLGNITEMWKNFKVFISGGDTGSVDIGSVLDFIVSLKVFPLPLDSFLGQPTHNVCIGRGKYPLVIPAQSESDTGVWKLLYTNYIVNCGTITVPRPFRDFRDYTNMNITAYLPYCGTVELNPGDVIGMQLTCKYSIDLQSGACVAFIEMYNEEDNKQYNVAMLSGQIGATIPITATNSGQIAARNLSAVFGGVSTIANTQMDIANRNANVLASIASKKKPRGVEERENATAMADVTSNIGMVESIAGQAISRLSDSAIAAPALSGGGNLAAFAQPACPYIQLRYGKYSYPENYKHSVGYPSTKSTTLKNYSGLVVCENVDIDKITCHNDEKAAIKALLETGVYL